MPPNLNSAATGGRPSSAIRWVRWALLLALVVVGAAALRLSATPIIEAAAEVGVPDEDYQRQTAVVMIEGAVLILSFLWLHPATRSEVRRMAAAGVIACLALSAAAGFWHYGWLVAVPVGVIPSLVYAWLVHVLSRELLGGAEHDGTADGTADDDGEVLERAAAPSWWQRLTAPAHRWSTRIDRRLESRAAAFEGLPDDRADRDDDTVTGEVAATGDEHDDGTTGTGDRSEHDDRADEHDDDGRRDEITRRRLDDDALRAELVARIRDGETVTTGGMLKVYVAGTGRMDRLIREAQLKARGTA